MAQAAGHKFGQAVGKYCELAIEPLLQEFANEHDLYLDRQGPRPTRKGTKLSWRDSSGNAHDLDYVLERWGTHERIGTPVAFVESAWRRYTKHSRNKAQEIQGALLPIAERYRFSAPMLGCVLAGVYTSGAIEQLKSVGFKVLHFPYESVVQAFASIGIDVHFDETTPDAELNKKLKQWQRVSKVKRVQARRKLLELNVDNVREFMDQLERSVKRIIESIRILPLFGSPMDCNSVAQAIQFVTQQAEDRSSGPLVKYEILIQYSSEERIVAELHDKVAAIQFLQAYETGNWTPMTNNQD